MISIRRQLTRRLLATTLCLLAISLAALLTVACYAVVHEFDIALRTKALVISTVTVVTDDTLRVEFTDRFLQGFDDKHPRDYFQLRLTDGRTVAKSESLGAAELDRRPGLKDKPVYFLCTLPNGRPGRAVAFLFKPKQARGVNRPVEAELIVATDRADLDETLLQLLGLAAGCGVLLLGATLWVVPRVLRWGLKSLDHLGDQAARIDAGSLAARFPVEELPEELQPIGGRLNDLLARLEQSFERERRFGADLAHELRTPIAELRSLAECALKWPESRDAATDGEVLAIARHMESLTASMLALARGERGQLAGPLETIDAAALIQSAWRPFAAQAETRALLVEFSLAPLTVAADPVLLRSILSNLFDNAVAYAPEAGRIRIGLEPQGAGVAITVGNPAGNLEATDVANLFDPFWRKEAARSGGQHVGLGLSLARTFARAMGWTLSATLSGQRHIEMRLASPP